MASRPLAQSYLSCKDEWMNDTYTHGHEDSVLRSHRWRTAVNSAAYLLPRLHPGMSMLDVGCGPGTITADFAQLLAPGRVIGIDFAPSVVDEANAQPDLPENCTFATGDVYHLDFADDTFDVVHAHQVLQHLTNPVGALSEMRRVLRPGGIVAVRDCDYQGFFWAPHEPELDRWMVLHHAVAAHNGAEPDAGRHLPRWVRESGLTELQISGDLWTFSDEASRTWWGGSWADRVLNSTFATQALAYGLSTRSELESISAAWRRWLNDESATFGVPNIEVISTK
jgi:SAM-dependent methyltransferase